MHIIDTVRDTALIAVAALALVPSPAHAPARADYTAAQHAILASEIARVAAGRPCVAPTSLRAGTLPRFVVVSPWNGGRSTGWASNVAELMPLDAAWTAAKTGEVAVRCVIV